MVRSYTKEALRYLVEVEGCDMVIVACNTASADAVPSLVQSGAFEDVPILGVLTPTAEAAISTTGGAGVGVLATASTIASGAYQRLLTSAGVSHVVANPAPLLVPLIEEGWAASLEARRIFKHYLKPLKDAGCDTLILGCTHYPLLLPFISALIPRGMQVIASDMAMPRFLEEHYAFLFDVSERQGTVRYLTTDCPDHFLERIQSLLHIGGRIDVEKVDIRGSE